MADKNTNFKIYIKQTKEWINVSESVYYAYYRPIWRTRVKMQRYGECSCSKKHIFLCDGICIDCEFYLGNNTMSLFEPLGDDSFPLEETLSDYTQNVEEAIQKNDMIKKLYEEIQNLSDIEQKICLLLLEGKTETEIAKRLKVNSVSNITYWKKKAFGQLKKRLEKFY